VAAGCDAGARDYFLQAFLHGCRFDEKLV